MKVLLTTKIGVGTDDARAPVAKDVVISEIMWALDDGE